MILCAPKMIDFMPDAQTLFTVVQHVEKSSPPKIALCLAGACPCPALNTFPIIHSWTSLGSIPARSTADRIANAPSCGAEKEERVPPKLPIGVRATDAITTSTSFRDMSGKKEKEKKKKKKKRRKRKRIYF